MADTMKTLDWDQVAIQQGVLREPTPENDRLVLWLPDRQDRGSQYWHRVSTVPHAAITRCEGLCTIPATAIRARQLDQHFLSRLVGPLPPRRGGSHLAAS